MRLIDETFEKLARGRVLGEVVLDDVDAFVLQVGDRLPAGVSGALEVDFELHARGIIAPGILIGGHR